MNTPTRLSIKVVPGASRSELAGWLEDTLRVRVAKPAERGKANEAVEALLCDVLRIPRNAIRIVSGGRTPRKTVEFDLDEAEVYRRLNEAMASSPPTP